MRQIIFFLFLFLSIGLHSDTTPPGETVYIGDIEGSETRINQLIQAGYLEYELNDQGQPARDGDGNRILNFTTNQDGSPRNLRLHFVGDLSGQNFDGGNQGLDTRNIEIREMLLSLSERNRGRVSWNLGNHEYNRLSYIRNDVIFNSNPDSLSEADSAIRSAYVDWLNTTDAPGEDFSAKFNSPLNRAQFWAQIYYGPSDRDPPNFSPDFKNPIVHYQRELTDRLGREVSLAEAAERFQADLDVTAAEDGRPRGSMARWLFSENSSELEEVDGVFRGHGPPGPAVRQRVIPLVEERPSSGSSFVESRSRLFFETQRTEFLDRVRSGEVPRDVLPFLGDAAFDERTGVIGAAQTTTYSERLDFDREIGGQNFKIRTSGFTADDLAEFCAGVPTGRPCTYVSGHKPAGNLPDVYRIDYIDTEGNPAVFYELGVDTSRQSGTDGVVVSIADNGDINFRGSVNIGGELVQVSYTANNHPMIGRVTEDGYLIKGVTSDGQFLVERSGVYGVGRNGDYGYQSRQVDTQIRNADQLGDTFFPEARLEASNATQRRLRTLSNAITSDGNNPGRLASSLDDVNSFIRGRTIFDFRGDADYETRLTQQQADELRIQLSALADELDPNEVVILKRGNTVANATDGARIVENIVSEVFGEHPKGFDLVGVLHGDTQVGQVDERVNQFFITPADDGFGGVFNASNRILTEGNGAIYNIGGQAEVARSARTPEGLRLALEGRVFNVEGIAGFSSDTSTPGERITLSGIDDSIEQVIASSRNEAIRAPTSDVDRIDLETDRSHFSTGTNCKIDHLRNARNSLSP